MTDINALRERVEAAEQRFGLMDEQQRHYSERVIGLIETIEAQLQAARGEIEKQIDENRQLGRDLAAARGEIEQTSAENGQLVQDLTTARAEETNPRADALSPDVWRREHRCKLFMKSVAATPAGLMIQLCLPNPTGNAAAAVTPVFNDRSTANTCCYVPSPGQK